jgi:transposase-like protein
MLAQLLIAEADAFVAMWKDVKLADGRNRIVRQARMEDNAECMLILIGATPEGKKKLVGFQTGVRESAQSWRELLIDIKQRGLEIAPDLAVGDGALGFWRAIEEVFPAIRHQRYWVHKTANVLNKVALSVQVNMKADLREIYGAPTRAAAEVAIDVFAEKYGAKYDKAVVCLTKAGKLCLPSSTFLPSTGIICARQIRSRAYSRQCVIEPCGQRARYRQRPPSSWCVVQGVKFKNGIEVTDMPAHHAA